MCFDITDVQKQRGYFLFGLAVSCDQIWATHMAERFFLYLLQLSGFTVQSWEE